MIDLLQPVRHYSARRLCLGGLRNEEGPQERGPKPKGLWLSVDDGWGWRDWCEAERYRPEKLTHAHDIELDPDAPLLWITTAGDLLNFGAEYGAELLPGYRVIAWDRVAQDYEGIIIAPYQWELRLDARVSWYYGWDCSSGCLWNPAEVVVDVRPTRL